MLDPSRRLFVGIRELQALQFRVIGTDDLNTHWQSALVETRGDVQRRASGHHYRDDNFDPTMVSVHYYGIYIAR